MVLKKVNLELTDQPSSGDDESVLAQLREERLLELLSASTDSLRFISPVSLTNPQLLTGDKDTNTKCVQLKKMFEFFFIYIFLLKSMAK